MNQVPEERKSAVLKTMAILGFVAVIIFGVWLAVQIVSYIPGAFSSLATTFESVQNGARMPQLTMELESDVVDAGDRFTTSWNDTGRAGNFTFTYSCVEGVALDRVEAGGRTTALTCGAPTELGRSTSITLVASSERDRFTDVPFTVTFVAENDRSISVSDDAIVTIVNKDIPQGVAVTEPDPAPTTPEPVITPTEPAPTPTPAPQPEPEVIEVPVYTIPVSDPDGFTDLAVRLIAVGHLTDDNEFVPRTNIDTDARGAYQFEVKNIGTKTSEEWEFEATFTSGSTYRSDDEAPLRPNERALFTIGFGAVGDEGVHRIGVNVDTDDDINLGNNGFSWAVSVVD